MKLKRKTKDKRPRRILFVDGHALAIRFNDEQHLSLFMRRVEDSHRALMSLKGQDGSDISVRPSQVSAIMGQRDG